MHSLSLPDFVFTLKVTSWARLYRLFSLESLLCATRIQMKLKLILRRSSHQPCVNSKATLQPAFARKPVRVNFFSFPCPLSLQPPWSFPSLCLDGKTKQSNPKALKEDSEPTHGSKKKQQPDLEKRLNALDASGQMAAASSKKPPKKGEYPSRMCPSPCSLLLTCYPFSDLVDLCYLFSSLQTRTHLPKTTRTRNQD